MNLREIHAHVEIRTQDAEDWLAVMDLAMKDTAVPADQAAQIMAAFRRPCAGERGRLRLPQPFG
jgi:hemoglobin